MNVFLLIIFLAKLNFAFASECKFSSDPILLSQSENELHQFWISDDNKVFSSNVLPNSTLFSAYLSDIKNKIRNTNPYVLLNKEYKDFMNSGDPALIAEAANMDLARNNKAGVFHSVSCLEALLLEQQIARGLSWDRPMEFSAFVLKKELNGKPNLKIYYSTNDRAGGKLNSQVMDLIQIDVANGWLLLKHIHNHTFNTLAAKNIILVGAPSPGLTDVALYRDLYTSLGLRSASVTNGFDTLEFKSADFFNFHTR